MLYPGSKEVSRGGMEDAPSFIGDRAARPEHVPELPIEHRAWILHIINILGLKQGEDVRFKLDRQSIHSIKVRHKFAGQSCEAPNRFTDR